ncbi:hypothetical protein KUTeg_019119 [Tegillarca granosa]|uniref:INTS8 TPR repeats domain-containing protein n=1 Tax=Tegillarca granosa TaxID=220873 RepID=A0ABQ9EBM3_TEGGR|nr:hypothetical protein KUTeg_019119 [Tegillarca granosa]
MPCIRHFRKNTIGKAFEGASNQQKSNLKHLIDLSSPGSKFPALVINGNLKDYFTEDELNEMELFTNDDNSNASAYNDMYDDATTVCSSFPTSRDSSVVMGNTEYQLIHMYDTDIIRRLVVELCQTRNRPPSYAMSLNEKWRVPKEMHQILFNMQPSCDQAFVYILIGKACHCLDVRLSLTELSYTLSKHVRWYILLVDLQQYFLNEMLGESMSLQDLVKKTKTCITSVRLGQVIISIPYFVDIQPSHEVLEHCAAFLMNIRDWAYLSNLENTANGHIELCLLVSSLLKELSSVKNSRKVARDVWDADIWNIVASVSLNLNNSPMLNDCCISVVNIFSSAAHRRINTGRGSAFSRDPQLAVLSKEEFREFLKKLKEPTALSIFVSLLTKLYNILRDDISCEISSDYVALWPSALVNANTIHPSSIDETVLMLMQHVLQVNPAHPSWLRTQADILFANGQYSPAMKYYMEAGVVASDFFSSAVPKSIYDDQVYRRMIKCCSYLQCYTQMRVLSQLDLNSNNPEDIVQRAVQMRKRKFLRSLAKQYL